MQLLNLTNGIVQLSLSAPDIRLIAQSVNAGLNTLDLTDDQDLALSSFGVALNAIVIALDTQFNSLHHNPPKQRLHNPHYPQAA